MTEKNKTLKDCKMKLLAVQDALDIFSGKWKIPILSSLIYLEEARFKEIQRMIGNITPKMLSKELKDLEINLLVNREVLDTRPVTVIYKLTDYGKSSKSVIMALYDWGQKHRDKIIRGK